MRFIKKLLSLLTAVCIMVGCCHNINVNLYNDSSYSQKIMNFTKSVVMLEAQKDVKIGKHIYSHIVYASGVAIDKDHILTAGHFCTYYQNGVKLGMFYDFFDLRYFNHNGKLDITLGAKIVSIDSNLDLCLLEKKNHGIVPAQLASDHYRIEKAYAIGAPDRVFPMLSEGTLQFTSEGKIYFNNPTYHGMSGGPVYNENGQILGIVIQGSAVYEHICIAVAYWEVEKFLRDNKINGKQ